MNLVSLPVALMATICIYVGFYHLWMYFRRRQDMVNLTFALMCFSITLYDLFCIGLYNATTITGGMFWQRYQLASIVLFAASTLWFIYSFTRHKQRKPFIIISILFAIFFILGLTVSNELTLSAANPMIKHVQLGRHINITYYEAYPGHIYLLQYISMMVGFSYGLFLIIKYYRSGNKSHTRPILISIISFFIAAINDVLVGTSVYPFIYMMEYAYMFIILSMAYGLLNKFIDLYQEVEELNIHLGRKVNEINTLYEGSNLILLEKDIKGILNSLMKHLPYIFMFLYEKKDDQLKIIEYGFTSNKKIVDEKVKEFLPAFSENLCNDSELEYSKLVDFASVNLGVEYIDIFNLRKEKDLGTVICIKASNDLEDFVEQYKQITSTVSLITLMLYNRNLQQELIKEERQSALGRVSASLIHDIKNPLAVIMGYAGYLADKNLENDEKEEYISAMDEEMQGILSMTREVLDFSRGQIELEKSKKEFSGFLNDLIKNAENIFSEDKIELNLNIQTKAELNLDYNRMKRVFFNLIKNSVEVLQPGQGIVEVSFYRENGVCILKISDNGPGIPDEIKDNLFDPFVTSGKHTGTGLGTAIAKKVVEEHEGEIWFESESGKGTSFFIKLPVISIT